MFRFDVLISVSRGLPSINKFYVITFLSFRLKSKCNTEKPYILITGGKIDTKVCSVNKTTACLFLGLQKTMFCM